jgi:hypothetical protein
MFFWGAQAARAEQQWQSPFVYDPFSFHSVTSWTHLERQASQPTESLMTEESRSIHSRALPNYKRAEIPRSKLEGYALNPEHEPDGKHKARVFKSALGFDQSTWEQLKHRILDELPYHEAKPNQTSQYGNSYVVDLPIEGLNGNTAKVRTAWMFKTGTNYPSLTTVLVLPKRK